MKAPRETDLVRACLQLLRLRGVLAWRVNSGAVAGEYRGRRRFVKFNTAKGCSDILGILPGGRFLAVECKMPGRKTTPDQAAFLDAVRMAGGLALVVRDVRELQAALVGQGHGR
jgi:hypothetical protein